MSDFVDIGFKLGRIVLKTLLKMDTSKARSTTILRSLGGEEQEKIILQKIAKYWNRKWYDRPDGLVVVTNHRLVFLSKIKTILTTTDYLSFPVEMIEHLDATKIWYISPAIRFQVQGEEYVFTFFANAAEVVEAIRAAQQSLSSLLERTT